MVFGIDCDIEPPHTRQFREFHSLPLLSPASPCKISLLLITIPESLFIDLIKAHTKTLTIVIGSWFNMKKKLSLQMLYHLRDLKKQKRSRLCSLPHAFSATWCCSLSHFLSLSSFCSISYN